MFTRFTIRKENVDGDMLYVARVAEFPNLCAYESRHEDALSIIRDAISTVKTLSDECGEAMPEPVRISDSGFSGRVTLRLPKSLHAHVDRLATDDGISLNQYLVAVIANHAGQVTGTIRASQQLDTALTRMLSHTLFLAGKAFSGAGQTASISNAQKFSTGPEWFSVNSPIGVVGNA